jgi:hypothetical protein
MIPNVGAIDRVARVVIGAALIVLPFITEFPIWANDIVRYGAIIVGVVVLGTAAFQFCPLYRVLGLSTRKAD